MRTKKITSTRSRENPDAHRDFGDFAVDEELRRLREALRTGQPLVAADLAANLDEYLSRGGPLPVAWLGPVCTQEKSDITHRHRDAAERAAKMSPRDREDAIWGYVDPRPVTRRSS